MGWERWKGAVAGREEGRGKCRERVADGVPRRPVAVTNSMICKVCRGEQHDKVAGPCYTVSRMVRKTQQLLSGIVFPETQRPAAS